MNSQERMVQLTTRSGLVISSLSRRLVRYSKYEMRERGPASAHDVGSVSLAMMSAALRLREKWKTERKGIRPA